VVPVGSRQPQGGQGVGVRHALAARQPVPAPRGAARLRQLQDLRHRAAAARAGAGVPVVQADAAAQARSPAPGLAVAALVGDGQPAPRARAAHRARGGRGVRRRVRGVPLGLPAPHQRRRDPRRQGAAPPVPRGTIDALRHRRRPLGARALVRAGARVVPLAQGAGGPRVGPALGHQHDGAAAGPRAGGPLRAGRGAGRRPPGVHEGLPEPARRPGAVTTGADPDALGSAPPWVQCSASRRHAPPVSLPVVPQVTGGWIGCCGGGSAVCGVCGAEGGGLGVVGWAAGGCGSGGWAQLSTAKSAPPAPTSSSTARPDRPIEVPRVFPWAAAGPGCVDGS
jgi:hypothetical protein